MELSCRLEYALLALLELADRYPQGEPLQIRQIAAQQNIPDRYLEQLLATLRRGGIVLSQRGAKGGYLLAREPWTITLWDVIDCLEGGAAVNRKDATAMVADREAIAAIWQEVCAGARAVWQQYSLQDLCEQRRARSQVNPMYYI
ncbi:MAG: Rrf2 family transcriptional regulator [Spirulinaceae cyanobacterium RM2_2_10]|nr:Rrf2 family transcriptional regulator [Spirulinaceae cyanobacterium SM2_1_0]NJO19374.1 Rrf2 family transcriptional regulator [Spirulinaceae cyanobacterium RM2_2_10]